MTLCSRVEGVCWAAALLVALAMPAAGASWITPDYTSAAEPGFAAVPLYWYSVDATPFIYRTAVTTPAGCDRATAVARTSGYFYVWVDGRRVAAYAPPKDSPSTTHDVPLDLTGSLSARGVHLLAVSAPRAGFALDGGFYAGTRRLSAIATGPTWRVCKLPPTTVVELDPVLRPRYAGPSAPVRTGEALQVPEDTLAAAHYSAECSRLRTRLDDVLWRLDLEARKGIYLRHGQERRWGQGLRTVPAGTPEPGTLAAAGRRVLDRLRAAASRPVETVAGLAAALPGLRRLHADVERLARGADAVAAAWAQEDDRQLLSLAAPVAGVKAPGTGSATARLLAQVEHRLGHPLSPLNESRYDRLGWLPLPGLSDDDSGAWGIRVRPAVGPAVVQVPSRWLFRTDPANTGIEEKRWSIGYNIETQWPTIEAGKPWQESEAGRAYAGVAWYRARVRVPGEWAGERVVVRCRVGGAARFWVNDHEVAVSPAASAMPAWDVPASLVTFGGENVLAFRVESAAAPSGLLGPVEVSCPALQGGRAAPGADAVVRSTPLSPCVFLSPRGSVLEIHHAAGARLWLPGRRGPDTTEYARARDGRLRDAGVFLWLTPSVAGGSERPVLLVFPRNPASIRVAGNVTRVVLQGSSGKPGEGREIIAVRPWVKALPPTDAAAVERARTFWSRAAQAVPVAYACVTRVVRRADRSAVVSVDHMPPGPVLQHTNVYSYRERRDEWGTVPLKLAPLPPLCSLALDSGYRTLKVAGLPRVLQDGGMVSPYRAVAGADSVTYRYEVEPYRRRIGFTSWMFGGADVGVPGNYREMQLIALAGVESYRPQHNFSDNPSPSYRGQLRVAVLVDACRRAGVNYTNNIDETLDHPREFVRDQYERFIDDVVAHTEKVARIVGVLPFEMVGYDLINEPFDHLHGPYNAAMKRLTEAVRRIDRTHPLYVEPCESWGAIQQILLVEPTGDPLTLYSFHDYNFRLNQASDRWPTAEKDIADICRMWLPAFRYQAMHGVPMHCGEFGDFRGETFQSDAQTYLLGDFFRLFDQFGMHDHYYSGRAIYTVEADGSLTPSNVVRTYRRYTARPDVNVLWGGGRGPVDRYVRPDYSGIPAP